MISTKKLAAGILQRTGLRFLLDRVIGWSGLVTLGYHRIGDGSDSPFDRELWSATAEQFDAQLRFLRSNADVIHASDLNDVVRRRTGRNVLITFDDGYRDNFETALPILRAHDLPATFFISTGFIDRPHLAWWDELAWLVRHSPRNVVPPTRWLPVRVVLARNRESAIRTLARPAKTLRTPEREQYLEALAAELGIGRPGPDVAKDLWMTWDMVRGLHAAEMEIGGHTVHHPRLATLSRAEQDEEIAGCAQRLRQELDLPMTVFSYPYGAADSFNADSTACLQAGQVRYAFNLMGGCWTWTRDTERRCYHVPRICVRDTSGLNLFRARITMPRIFG